VMPDTNSTVEMLKKNGFSPVFKESVVDIPGSTGDYLNGFAPQLFQEERAKSRAVVARLIADHVPLA
jgi:hypothetical protein